MGSFVTGVLIQERTVADGTALSLNALRDVALGTLLLILLYKVHPQYLHSWPFGNIIKKVQVSSSYA